MNRWTYQFFTPVFLFLLMLFDSHLSQILSQLTGNVFVPVSHICLIALIYAIKQHRERYLVIMSALLGLVYDSYFIGVWGLATAILPIIALFVFESEPVVFANRWTRLATIIIIVFAFETLVPLIETIFGLISLNLFSFVVTQLAPTLLLNILLAVLLQWPFEKLYQIK